MTDTTSKKNSTLQLVVIAGLLLAAFFGAYKFASARNSSARPLAPAAGAAQTSPGDVVETASGSGNAAAAAAGGCACCGGAGSTPPVDGISGAPVEGTAKISGGIQAIAVEVGTTYSPNIIKLKAGIPAEITFGQGGGCTAQVVSQDLGFSADLSAGPQVVKVAALSKGTYSFSCGMSMVFGKIVVE